MIGPRDWQLSQQVWPDLVLRMLLAGVGPFIDRLQPHDAHQAAHAVPSRREPGLGKIRRNLAAAKERVLRKDPINLVHQINRGLIKANGRVVDRRPADLEQLALARQAQICIFFADHIAAFDWGSSLQPL